MFLVELSFLIVKSKDLPLFKFGILLAFFFLILLDVFLRVLNIWNWFYLKSKLNSDKLLLNFLFSLLFILLLGKHFVFLALKTYYIVLYSNNPGKKLLKS